MSELERGKHPILSAHSWSYGGLALDEIMEVVSSAGYAGIDLGSGELGREAGLEVDHLISNPSFARQIRSLAVTNKLIVNDYFAWLSHPVNTTNLEQRSQNRRTFEALVPRLVEAGVLGVTMSPGGYAPDQWSEAFEACASNLRELVSAADGRLPVRIEAHVESVTDTPERTLIMLRQVKGLSLTLDYSHYVVQGIPEAAIEPLTSFATHVHVRQAREGVLAERVESGTIDVPRLLRRLLAQGYAGGITVEYVSSPWREQDVVDSAAENAAMFAQLTSLLAELTMTKRESSS